MREGRREMLEAEGQRQQKKGLAFGTRQAYAWQTILLDFQLHFMSVTLALVLRRLRGSSCALPR